MHRVWLIQQQGRVKRIYLNLWHNEHQRTETGLTRGTVLWETMRWSRSTNPNSALQSLWRSPFARSLCSVHSFIHSFRNFYSASSSPLLLRGAPDYSIDTVAVNTPKCYRQLWVKDLPKVFTWQLEWDSNLRPTECKEPFYPGLITGLRANCNSVLYGLPKSTLSPLTCYSHCISSS